MDAADMPSEILLKGEDRGTPVYQPVQPLEGAFQNLTRTWAIKRDGLVGGKRLSMIPQRVQTPPPLLPAWASKNPTRAQYMAAKQGTMATNSVFLMVEILEKFKKKAP